MSLTLLGQAEKKEKSRKEKLEKMNIKDRMLKFLEERGGVSYFILPLILLVLLIIFFLSLNQTVLSLTAVNTSKANLTIWDTTDSAEKYTYPTCYETYNSYSCTQKTFAQYNIYFYANFTNRSSGASIPSVDSGNCSIRFNENLTGTFTGWVNMTYSSSTGQYQYNRSFKYKGGIPFEVNCTNGTYGTVNASENATISNTRPSIFAKDSITEKLPSQSVTEDRIFYYNFSENCTDDDQNDIPSLGYNYISGNTTLPAGNFTFVTSTGNLTINMSTDTDVGDGVDKIVFSCSDGVALTQYAEMNFTITAVNDAPIFINLNDTMNATENQEFNFTLQARDEENNTPFYFNATFVNCSTMNWSTRNSSKCNLFNLTGWRNSTAITINFTPTNNDVGNYTIEFNVTDLGNTILPYNATRIKTIIFTVININNPPVITYVCNNERNATEDANFACWITANDTDESYNLTFSSNLTWFTFNNSLTRFTDNISDNSTAQINFTANDSAVGVWYINITVNDTAGGMNSTVINFNVSNVNDSVILAQINNSFESYMQAQFYLEINASDDDLRIPRQGKSCASSPTVICYNETLTFERNITGLVAGGNNPGINTTLFRIVKNATSGNTTTAYIRFTPSQDDAGNYSINITVRDANNNSINSRVFNLSIFANTVPYWRSPLQTTFNIDELNPGQTFSLNFYQNATDADGDAITFSDNTGLFNINSSGYLSIGTDKANDSDVGTYSVTITLTDARGAVNSTPGFSFTFRVRNVNETPVLYAISTPQSATEDSAFSLTMYANDEDLSLNTSATDFYSENIVWSLNSTTSWFNGANATIKLNFTRVDNRSATISFTPNKTDVGTHTINITVNDSTGRMNSSEFTLTVSETNHMPWFTYTGSPLNVTLNASNNYTCIECIDINVSDVEDGNDNLPNTAFSFTSNESWFKISNATGKVNFTAVNKTFAKANGWWINLTVFDAGVGGSGNKSNSTLFRLMIYEYNLPPSIERVTPQESQVNTAENSSKLFTVIVTDENTHAPNSDTLNITWKIDGVVNKTADVTNGSTNSITYTTNFTDETTNRTAHNISIWVYDSQNNLTIMSWNVTVNHTNAPPQFTSTISNITMSGTSSVNVSCDFSSSSGMCSYSGTEVAAGGYFYDADHSDAKYNQSVNLSLGIMDSSCNVTRSNSSISVNLNGNTLKATFYTTSTAAECFNITATDSQNASYNATSNKFIINLTVSEPTTTPTPVAGGGGGGGAETRKTPVALKIIMPEPMTMYTKDRIIVPISILNNGSIDLYDISLSISTLPPGLQALLSKSHFDKLAAKQKESIEMTIITNTNATGTYEIILTGTSKIPSYTDSASFFLNLIELGWKEKIKAQEKIIFLQELLLGNPECLELQEVLNEAKKEFENKNYQKSLQLSEAAIQACKYAVASKGKTVEIKKKFKIQDFALPALGGLFVFLVLYLIYHYTQRRMLKKGR